MYWKWINMFGLLLSVILAWGMQEGKSHTHDADDSSHIPVSTRPVSLSRLPEEIQSHILSFLEVQDLGRLSQTSAHFKRLADDPYLWQKILKRNEDFEQTYLPFLALSSLINYPKVLVFHTLSLIHEVFIDPLPIGVSAAIISLPNLNIITCRAAGGRFKLAIPISPYRSVSCFYALYGFQRGIDIVSACNGKIEGLLHLPGFTAPPHYFKGRLFHPSQENVSYLYSTVPLAHHTTRVMRITIYPFKVAGENLYFALGSSQKNLAHP